MNILFNIVICFRNMWSIVYFIDEHTVDVVPDFWYKKGFCAWPKKKLNDKKFIEKRIKPNKEDFSFYKARPLLQNIGKYKILYVHYWILYNI